MFYRSIYFSSSLLKLTNFYSLNFIGFSAQKNLLKLSQSICRFSDDSISNVKRDASAPLSEFEERKIQCEEIVEQVKLMNEYYSQYIDEYYEEFGDEDSFEIENLIDNTNSKEEFIQKLNELHEYRKSLPLITELSIDNFVDFLREQRAKNIACLHMPLSHSKRLFSNEYIVICESHKYRHANAMILNIRKFIKNNYRFPKSYPQKIRNGDVLDWVKLDLYKIELHILTPKTRRHYALESLYAFDDDWLLNENLQFGLNKDFLPPPLCDSNTEFIDSGEKIN